MKAIVTLLSRTSFYADDKSDEVDVVATHPFDTLLATRWQFE